MMKKVTRIIGVLFLAFAIYSLSFTIYKTTLTDGETCKMVLNGFSILKFSPWASFVITIPLLMLGIMFSKLKDNKKMLLTSGLCAFDIFSLYIAHSAAREWIYGIATGFVYNTSSMLGLYAISLMIATILFYISCNASKDQPFRIVPKFVEDYMISKFFIEYEEE